MKIPINFGAGGGSGSDDCTAEAADVLASKTAIYLGTDDEPVAGSMADYSGTTASAAISLDSGNSRLQMTVPYTGKYDTSAKLYQSYSQVRTLIGYTDASKVLSGTTILGLAGTMADRSGTTSSATSSLDTSNSRVRLQIPSNGYYNTSAYLYQSYSNIASLIGLTAAKIRYGETILGITGTSQGYVATSSDLYYNGSEGTLCGTMATYNPISGNTLTKGSSCITIQSTTTSASYIALGWPTTLNCGAYSKITLTYNVTSAISSTSAYIAIALYTSRPTAATDFATSNATKYASADLTSTGSSRTLSIDISGISSNLYVGAVVYRPLLSSGTTLTVEITRIQVS